MTEIPSGPGPGLEVESNPDCAEQGPLGSPLRRLTRSEYNYSVRDLFHTTLPMDEALPPDPIALGFDNNAALQSVSQVIAETYMSNSEAVAAEAVKDLHGLLSCDPSTGDPCAQSFIADYGRQAYRRPLSDVEASQLLEIYHLGAATSFAHGIELVIRALLQSSNFLYRFEFGSSAADAADLVPLTQYEVATRLSYFLWKTTPNVVLLDQAEAGAFATREAIGEAARTMLADPRFERALSDFHTQWLDLRHVGDVAKNPEVYPEFSDEVRAALVQQVPEFVRYVFNQSDARLGTLLTAPIAPVNAALAPLYGANVAGQPFEMVQFEPSERSGILSLSSVLSMHAISNQSSPVHRGKLVRLRLLCQELPPVPPDLVVTPPELDPNLTTRERFEQHGSDAACSPCHQLMDPIGLGFENYDGIGRYRTEEAGQTIDATGLLVDTRDIDGPFDGVSDLAQKLSGSSEVHDCVVREWFRYGFGRQEGAADTCTLDAVADAFAASNGDLREVLVAFAQSDSFLFRQRIVAEGGTP